MVKVDLHIHTFDDPVDHIRHSAYELVDRAVALGFGALAITLHDRQFGDQYLLDYARERGLVLIPGVERTIQGKHILLINFPQEAERVRSFDEVRRLKTRHDGLVVAPHPFFPDESCLRARIDEAPDLFDAVEWSYFWTRGVNFNAFAKDWADRHGKPLVGNSDLHDLRQLGRTCSLVYSECQADAIVDAIRSGLVRVRTAPVAPTELARVFGGMLWRGRKSANQLEIPGEQSHPQVIGALPGILE